MKPESRRRRSSQTPYVILDTRKCTACWECLDACPNQVIGRISLPWHKHARFLDGDCNGCMKCVKICIPGALTRARVVA